VEILVGESYSDAGCIAMDGLGHDLGAYVLREGEVDSNRAGEYFVCYSLMGADGQGVSVTRVVNVLPQPRPETVIPAGKTIYLTFDDGPGPYTEELLDFLQQEGVRATFFVLGTRVDSYPRLIRRMAAEGHEVGNHSNAHNMLNRMDLVGVRKEMGRCAEKIEKLLGYRPSVMRCPGGNTSSTVTKYAQEAGIPIAYWSVDTLDWKSRDKDAILNIAFGKNGIKDGSIVLMHDIHKTTIPAAKEMILRLKEEGYTFVTTSELIAARRGGIVPGKQYS
jgi:peptidoglycan/xylan/chitin deacetylase (PgdA/CDA1 family)